MRKLGALVIGVSRGLATDSVAVSELRYAEADATAVASYLERSWPRSEMRCIQSLVGPAATVHAARKALAELRGSAPYDILFVFFAGHGASPDSSPGLVLSPDAPRGGSNVLTAAELDASIANVEAHATLIVLDCCFAESAVRHMPLLSRLDGTHARLFVGSSRSSQITWEEDRVEHGIFTAFLLDVLLTGRTSTSLAHRDVVDVEKELFPFLAAQVPLYVYTTKHAHQEPVRAGIAAAPILLPIAPASSSVTRSTPLRTAMRRVRQILVAAAAIVTVAALTGYGATYHIRLEPNGTLAVRYGVQPLAPLGRLLPAIRVATALDVSDLSDDPLARFQVQTGSPWGFWMQRSITGERRWIDQVERLLAEPARLRVRMLSTGALPIETIAVEPDVAPSWRAKLVAAGLVLTSRPEPELTSWLDRAIPGRDRRTYAGGQFDPNFLDFAILDLTSPEFAEFAEAAGLRAFSSPDDAFRLVLGLLVAAQERLHQSKRGMSILVELHALGGALARLMNVRARSGAPPLSVAERAVLERALEAGYFDSVGGALAYAGQAPLDLAVVSRAAWRTLGTYDNAQGAALTDPQDSALRLLGNALDGSDASRNEVAKVVRWFGEVLGSPENTYLTRFLCRAARQDALPDDVRAGLFTRADRAARSDAEIDYVDLETVRVLAELGERLSLAERRAVLAFAEALPTRIAPQSESVAALYRILAREGLASQKLLDHVVAQVKAIVESEASRPEEIRMTTGLVVVGAPASWFDALGQFATSGPLRPEVQVLAQHAAVDARFRAFRGVVARGLSGGGFGQGMATDPAPLVGRLRDTATNSVWRSVLILKAAQELAGLSAPDFATALEVVRSRTTTEPEPEIRMDLSTLTIQAWRLRAPDVDPDEVIMDVSTLSY